MFLKDNIAKKSITWNEYNDWILWLEGEKGCYGCCKGTFEFAVAGIGLGIQVLTRDFGLGGNDWESESFGSFHEAEVYAKLLGTVTLQMTKAQK